MLKEATAKRQDKEVRLPTSSGTQISSPCTPNADHGGTRLYVCCAVFMLSSYSSLSLYASLLEWEHLPRVTVSLDYVSCFSFYRGSQLILTLV